MKLNSKGYSTRKSGGEMTEYQLGGFELVSKAITDVLSSEDGRVEEEE